MTVNGRIILDDVNSIEEPAKSFNWSARFLAPRNINNDDGTEIVTSTSGILYEVYVQNVQLPFEYFDVKQRYRGGGHMSFPADSNIDGFNVTFYETDKFKSLQFIMAWRRKMTKAYNGEDENSIYSVINPSNFNSTYQMPVNYMGKAIISMFDDLGNLVMTTTLYDVWPNRPSIDWTLDYTQNANLPLVSNFSCNSADVKIYKQGN